MICPGRIIAFFPLRNYHTVDFTQIQQTTNRIYFFFPQQICFDISSGDNGGSLAYTICMKCQFHLLGKIRNYFKMSAAEMFYPAVMFYPACYALKAQIYNNSIQQVMPRLCL